MPLFDYRCALGHRTEELVFEPIPDELVCPCGRPARRDVRVRVSVLGPVYSNMEHMEDALLTAADRRGGMRVDAEGKEYYQPPARFRGPADITAFETARGLNRLDRGSTAYRHAMEREREEELYPIARAREEGGVTHAADVVDRMNIQEATGWDNTQYNRWEEATHAVERKLESGAIDPDAV